MLPWMGGHPEAVLELARAMDLGAMRLAAIHGAMAPISTTGTWESPAGAEFGMAMARVVPTFAALIERYTGAVTALRDYAANLETAQVRDRQARERHRVADDALRRLESEESALRSSPADHELNLAAQRQERWRMREQEEAQRTLRAEFATADGRCAAKLRALAADRLTDGATYDIISNTNDTTTKLGPLALGVAFTALRPLSAINGVLNSTSQFAMLVLYQEGSWKEVGINAALSAVGLSAASLKFAATHGGKLVEGTAVGKYVATGTRLKAGARRAGANRVESYVQKFSPRSQASAKTTTKAPLPHDQNQSLRYRTGVKIRTALDDKVLNHWKVATAGGANAQRLYVAGLATSTGHKAGTNVPKVVAVFAAKTVNSGAPCGKGPTWTKSQHNLSLGVCQEQK